MWPMLLALVAAICWGLAPIAAKLALHRVSPIIGMGARSLIAAVMVSAWLLATGQFRAMPSVSGRPAVWLLVEAILATVVGDAFYFYALKQGHAGQVSLVLASSPLITLGVAALLLGESLSPQKVIGALLIVGGLVLIGL